MEAGNRCFDQRVPEELNRKIVDHLSDVNLTLTEHARRYLLAEGARPELVIKVGSSLPEVLTFHSNAIETSDVLSQMSLDAGGYFVVSAHREENVDNEKNFASLLQAVNKLATDFNKRIIFSTHPRTRARLHSTKDLPMDSRVKFLNPLGFIEYARLQRDAFCVVSDSGTVTEEASILGFPAVTIREAHERPEGMDSGVLVMSGLKPESVIEAVRIVTDQWKRAPGSRIVTDYGTHGVAERVVRIVMSYTEYVNRKIWSK
jgi:UDP-N-acetylglucosamine 2-epimerase (non-hydrolysing)